MRIHPVFTLAAILVAGCSSSPPPPATSRPPAKAIADEALGLAKGSVFDVPTPPAVKPNESNPGERPPLPRPYAAAPPRVPHALGDFLPITLKQNACVDCHAIKERAKGDPTPIPPSHYTDDRATPDRVGAQLAGTRYVCVSCHAGQTDAPSLVDNTFRP